MTLLKQKNKSKKIIKQGLSLTPYQDLCFKNMNELDKFENNEIYVIFKKSNEPIINSNLIQFYFPHQSQYTLDLSIFNQYRFKFNSSLDTTLKNKVLDVKNMENKYLIIELFSPELNDNLNINLEEIFNLINTNYGMPIVKIVKNDMIHKFKIFKTFLQKHQLQISSLLK